MNITQRASTKPGARQQQEEQGQDARTTSTQESSKTSTKPSAHPLKTQRASTKPTPDKIKPSAHQLHCGRANIEQQHGEEDRTTIRTPRNHACIRKLHSAAAQREGRESKKAAQNEEGGGRGGGRPRYPARPGTRRGRPRSIPGQARDSEGDGPARYPARPGPGP